MNNKVYVVYSGDQIIAVCDSEPDEHQVLKLMSDFNYANEGLAVSNAYVKEMYVTIPPKVKEEFNSISAHYVIYESDNRLNHHCGRSPYYVKICLLKSNKENFQIKFDYVTIGRTYTYNVMDYGRSIVKLDESFVSGMLEKFSYMEIAHGHIICDPVLMLCSRIGLLIKEV